jgi:excisionase family DNA binding protein
MKNSNRLYTIDKIAKIMSVHRETVKSWIQDEKLECIRIGYRTIRIDQKQLNKFIRNKKRKN